MAKPVRDQAGDHADQKLDDEGHRCFHDVDRVNQVTDCQANGTAKATVKRTEQQRSEHNEGVSEMNGNLAARGRNRYRQVRKDHIGQGGEDRRKCQLLQTQAAVRKACAGGVFQTRSFHIGFLLFLKLTRV